MGARDEHTLRAFLEAEAYDGPSIIIAYSHCIAHGIDMATAMNHQKAVVESGRWLLYRYNPELKKEGKNPLQLDMRSPKLSVEQTMYKENRFKMLTKSKPEDAKRLLKEAQEDVDNRWRMYEYLAARPLGATEEKSAEVSNGKGAEATNGKNGKNGNAKSSDEDTTTLSGKA
jgi:pyruvate-ferredoxin/flavodoxin oxidoreductase